MSCYSVGPKAEQISSKIVCHLGFLHQDPLDVVKRTVTGKTAGFDFGLTTFLMGDDGKSIQSPHPLLHALKLISKASSRLSRKLKGSSGRKKAKLALARLHRTVANIIKTLAARY